VFDFECELISPIKNQEEWENLKNDNLTPLRDLPDDENYQLHHVNCVSVHISTYQKIFLI